MIRILLLNLTLCCCSPALLAQENILTWEAFRSTILQTHPAAKQAELSVQNAQSALLVAKGGFDVKTYAGFESKNFNGKEYFSILDAGAKLPTWMGLELKSGYQYAQGTYLNPELTLPGAGQGSFGFTWSLGQGLLTDERRTNLRIAQTGLIMGEAEKNATLNKLVYEAAQTYWAWAFSSWQINILTDATQQAQKRHIALVESFLQGEKPAMDTLETFIQLQNRQLDLNFAAVEYQNALIQLSGFFWQSSTQPASNQSLSVSPTIIPAVEPEKIDLETLILTARQQHPELVFYQNKTKQLLAEQKLKNEKRKPVVDFNYNLLGKGWTFFTAPGVSGPAVLANDMKWGLQFSMPVTNRKAKGDLQMTRLKMVQNELYLAQKTLEIENKIKQYNNELKNLESQISLFRNITGNYKQLLDAESLKYVQGESSIFLINTREQRWLDAQLKYAKLTAAFFKSKAGLQWSTGQW